MFARFLIALFFACSAFGFAPSASAQMIVPATVPLFLDLSPRNPEPGAAIRISATSHSLDLTEARILWYVNEVLVGDDVGLTEITTRTGPASSALYVVATVIVNGDVVSGADVYIRPAEVDLLWEADSFTPPFYQGRKMPSPNSVVRAEARARLTDENGDFVPNEQIVYTWRRNNAVLQTQSGRGKNKVTLPAPLLFQTDTVSVEASLPDDSIRAETTALIPSADPVALIYQDHPLFGVFYHANLAPSTTFPDSEITLVAVPLFAPLITAATDALLSYDWRVNDQPVTEAPEAPDRLTINADNSSGQARVALSITHLRDIFMQAEGEWNILLNAGLGGVESTDPFAPTPSL